jgi:hypothetical protein
VYTWLTSALKSTFPWCFSRMWSYFWLIYSWFQFDLTQLSTVKSSLWRTSFLLSKFTTYTEFSIFSFFTRTKVISLQAYNQVFHPNLTPIFRHSETLTSGTSALHWTHLTRLILCTPGAWKLTQKSSKKGLRKVWLASPRVRFHFLMLLDCRASI